MDNRPLWDEALDAVEPGPSVAHLRKDTGMTQIGTKWLRPTGAVC
jgi:hypothetical protein